MKRVLFVMSHPEANLENLAEMLESHPNISCFSTGQAYYHPDDLHFLTSLPHKRDNATAIWADMILHNKDFSCRALERYCYFIYWVENPTDYRKLGLWKNYQKTGGLWNPTMDEVSYYLEGE